MSERTTVSASFVRSWARRRGLTVGQRGHLPQNVIQAFNRAHKTKVFVNANPWLKAATAA